jgi:FkbM family methyltransferase
MTDLPDSAAPNRIAPHVLRWIKDPASFVLPAGVLTNHVVLPDHEVTFAFTNPDDRIQRKHRRGKYYEPDELEAIRSYLKPGAVFCDLGSNIGNHTLFALLSLGAARSIVVEPNPAAYELLTINLILNNLLDRVDLSHLGFGVGSEASGGFGMSVPETNLGAGSLQAGTGDIEIRTADSLLADTPVDFIKIDVEGMEIAVLQGLRATLARCKPTVFVEIDRDNNTAFCALMAELGSVEALEVRKLRFNRNAIFTPA